MSSLPSNTPSINPSYVISIPSFHARYSKEFKDGPKTPKMLSAEMLKEDWLTDDLRLEIQSLFPDSNEKDGTGQRCPEAFQRKIGFLFPPGRVFASFTQLVQASKLFLDAWAIQKVHGQKKITCHYGKKAVSSNLHPDISKRRTRKASVKSLGCPFFISYSLVNFVASDMKPNILHHARVTSVNYEHTCCMSTTSHRVALCRSGEGTPNLDGMNTVMSLLKEQPGLSNTLLRPLLQKYLPHYKGMDAAFLRNFRARAFNFIVRDPLNELTIEDVKEVASRSAFVAADEVIDLDQPILLQNFTALLRKCMQESSSTWVALRYLDETKVRVPGFDYRVHYDPEGCPDGIVWMTPDMKLNLLQYGRILFLDAQKRQFNTSNWPYIGPAMKDCEMKVCLAAECLCIQECLDMYIWILEMLQEMEPRYQLSQTSIMFADELITPTVLTKFLYSQLSHQLSQQMLPSTVPFRPPYPSP